VIRTSRHTDSPDCMPTPDPADRALVRNRKDTTMPLTEKQVLDELRKNGITSMEGLAQKIAEQSAAKVEFDRVRGIPEGVESDYLWSGKNYSLYHPELA